MADSQQHVQTQVYQAELKFNATTMSQDAFKHQWARQVSRKALEADLEKVKKRTIDALQQNDGLTIPIAVEEDDDVTKLVNKTEKVTGVGFVPPGDGKNFKIGIVGAGVGGLFTAMVIDWLNEQVDGLTIDYDIFEAAGEDRLGGRLYTHKFSDKPHDYYDVGAMRFPNNPVMKRTFELFHMLGLKGKAGLLPYYLPDKDDTKCPLLFNDVLHYGNVWKGEKVADPFKINSGLPDDDQIKPHLLLQSPSDIVTAALKKIIDHTKQCFDEAHAEKKEGKESVKYKTLWDLLMAMDKMSVRQFLASDENKDLPSGPNYNYNTIEWLESVTYGTGWYDQALTESVLEELDFDTPRDEDGHNWWWCVDGGAQRIARLMAGKIHKPVQFNTRVTTIDAHVMDRKNPKTYVPMTLRTAKTDPVTKVLQTEKHDYFAVVNSTTLPALQRMNLRDAGLLWGTKQAIRALGYGASSKVGIRFSKPWWQLDPWKIDHGGISRTDLPLRVCVYPSYNTHEAEGEAWDPEGSAVLLCSYTWGQDAQRVASLVSSNSPADEEELKELLLHNLALMHVKEDWPYERLLPYLRGLYETHHAWDWHRDRNMGGAFAYFGPGQFSNMWEEIIKPNAFGQLYLVGEAASSHHAWIVGALESVIRAVYVMFEGLSSNPAPAIEKARPLYEKAMRLLAEGPGQAKPEGANPWDLPTGLPFFPLPTEMPQRQHDTGRKEDQTNDPKVEDKPLTYPAAVASLSLVESYFELMYSAEAA